MGHFTCHYLRNASVLGTLQNRNSYQLGKAMNPSQLTRRWLPRPHINGGICTTPVVMSTPDRDSLKPPCVPVSEVRDFCGNGKGKHSGPPEFIPAGRQNRRTFPFSNSIELSSIDRFKFRMSSTLCLSTATLEQRMQQDSGAEQHMECSGSLFQMPAMPSVEKERYGISVILL
ncbi:hypothetical protein ACLOJK_012180 [Asimina triloba]